MTHRRVAPVLALAILATGCSSAVTSGGNDVGGLLSPEVAAPGTDAPADTKVTVPPSTVTTVPPTPTTTPPPDTTPDTTAATTPTTAAPTPTTVAPLDVYDLQCALQVFPGETLEDIAALIDDDTVDPVTLMAENDLDTPELVADQLLDVCPDNGLDDIDGTTRAERAAVFVQREVMAQQEKLNELFAGYGIRELLVDGISGPVTRQRLCAFRLSANLPVSTEDMVAGSEEETLLMSTEELGIPFTSAILADRWALIDETCQIMFVGAGTEELRFVFPTSTGLPDFPTRPQVRSRAFKFDPALDNGGWHDSLDFPAVEDNPLNGNMYKPIYFDGGQAIHGANNVPRSPASHGCARLRLEHMDALVSWLGLDDATGVTYRTNEIGLAVNVQGRYVDR